MRTSSSFASSRRTGADAGEAPRRVGVPAGRRGRPGARRGVRRRLLRPGAARQRAHASNGPARVLRLAPPAHRSRLDGAARVALVVGTGERARRVVEALRQFPEAGWVIRGCVKLDAFDPEETMLDVPVIGSGPELQAILQSEGVVDEVFFAVPPERFEQ